MHLTNKLTPCLKGYTIISICDMSVQKYFNSFLQYFGYTKDFYTYGYVNSVMYDLDQATTYLVDFKIIIHNSFKRSCCLLLYFHLIILDRVMTS